MDLDAYVTEVLFDRSGAAWFALGDGSVAGEGGERAQAHAGAILAAVLHPSGDGLVTGGDDGRLAWTAGGATKELAALKGRWIDVVAANAESGLIAFGAGREARVLDTRDAAFERVFAHEKSVASLAFDARGRRLAAATYGGAVLWYARIAEQKPVLLKWPGSHILVVFSPDGRFLMSSMQENELHGWRLSDARDLRMGGYPAKVKSLVFLSKGMLMATAGAPGAVVWPFAGADGPMGKEAAEIGFEEGSTVTRVAAAPDRAILAAGLSDGRVWACDLTSRRIETIKAERGAPITALAMSAGAKRLAWGDEDGGAGVAALEGF
ncbi:MAG TPA: WD40 repeat domain-containing protein [Caulobacteraceae bacterium]|nr:WD40 repeat domain-containing protein [Caulobacteraceae bacterium]